MESIELHKVSIEFPERGEIYSSPMPSIPAPLSSAPLALEQYVSPSVIEKEARASNSQRGSVQFQEADPPVFSATGESR